MSKYHLDIERLKENEVKGKNTLKALVLLQYPIYIIHAEIVDESPDAYYGLDKALLKYLKSSRIFDSNAISKIFALPSSSIDNRIRNLKETHLLDKDYRVSSMGENFIAGQYEGLIQAVSKDFIVDGFDFKPLAEEFYSRKYRENINLENEYQFFLKDNGDTGIRYDYSPDITHTPINRDTVLSQILSIERDKRSQFNIPTGLKEIGAISYSLATLPIMVGLYKNKDGLIRKLVNCFESDGSGDSLQFIKENFKKRLDNLELRLNDYERKGKTTYSFNSNWKEIDIVGEEEKKLFFFSKEDLQNYFMNLYSIKELEVSDVIYQSSSIGLVINKGIFQSSGRKKKILNNVSRGGDYLIKHFVSSGVWAVFFEFKCGDKFIEQAVELLAFIDHNRSEEHFNYNLLDKIQEYPDYQEILIGLEEFDLLEEIDIKNFMITF